MDWKRVLANLASTFAVGFSAGYVAGGNWKIGLATGVAAVTGNQSGLYQKQPHA
jgi:hypothetical protein